MIMKKATPELIAEIKKSGKNGPVSRAKGSKYTNKQLIEIIDIFI